ncbi:MAG TPA: exodeoxyribonuclease III, partial [Firmicutes bacterium]|nr:exodeoxyribonuclease III [Bacillota bacterium]
FEEIGYHCEVRGQKAYAGVATLFREFPDEAVSGFLDGDETEDVRILHCRWKTLHVINTYCPQGRDPESEHFQNKLKWFKRLRKMFDLHYKTRQKILWMGDFNVAPEPIDVYDSPSIMGHVVHRPEVFVALKKVRDWGFIDLFRKFHPDEPGHYTYFDYRTRNSVQRKMGYRVDHIYTTASLAKKAVGCEIDMKPRLMDKPSDHTIMVAEFNL